MSPIATLLVMVASGLLSWWLSGRFRRYALATALLDLPNARSSHTVPTPRGGGMSFVAVSLGLIPLLMAGGVVPVHLGWGLLGGGALVAGCGWFDDRGHLAARWRLLAHGVAALWGMAWIGGVPIHQGWIAQGLGLLYLTWMINLFNFMDGIDAIASLEAVSVALVGAGLILVTTGVGAAGLPVVLPLLLAAAVTGFLVWNWPPARLFMGDAGSGFLGFTIGLLTLQAGHQKGSLLWSWMILSAVFLVDATWTLWRRFWRGERVTQAHRSHAYQRAARILGSHRLVSLWVVSINLVWLAPMAALVGVGRIDGPTGLVISLLPLWISAIALGAGAKGDEDQKT